jgi:hypothetical protein
MEEACSREEFKEMIIYLGDVSVLKNNYQSEDTCTLF